MIASQPGILLASIVLWGGVLRAPPLSAAEPAVETTPPTATSTAPASATESTAAGSPSGAEVLPVFSSPREAAIASVLERLDVAGKVQVVQQHAESFLTLVTTPHRSEPPVGAVLLIPAHGDAVSDTLLLALERAPTASGWLTMAIQPPITSPIVSDPGGEFCARITASLKFLQEQQAMPVVLAGIGRSFDHSLACYADTLPAEIAALVGIGRWQGSLNGLELPVLDVLPAMDREAQRAARRRAVAAEKRAHSGYRQILIEAADDFFEGGEEEVAKRLRGWLIQLPLRPKA